VNDFEEGCGGLRENKKERRGLVGLGKFEKKGKGRIGYERVPKIRA
jgi:hypothetical protein